MVFKRVLLGLSKHTQQRQRDRKKRSSDAAVCSNFFSYFILISGFQSFRKLTDVTRSHPELQMGKNITKSV